MNEEPIMKKPEINRHRGPWCAECGREKRADNHWLAVFVARHEFLVIRLDDPRCGATARPVCGGECANVAWARWLARAIGLRHMNPPPERNPDDQADGTK